MTEENTTAGNVVLLTTSADWDQAIVLSMYVCSGIIVAIPVIILWIILNMLEYGRRNKRWDLKSKRGKIYISSFAAVMASLLSVSSGMPLLFIDANTRACELLGDITAFLTGLTMVSIHMFLWLRQSFIYDDTLIKPSTPKVILCVGYLNLGLAVISYPIFAMLFAYEKHFTVGPYGCYVTPIGSRGGVMDFRGSSFIIGSVLILQQLMLLGLFVYPIYRFSLSNTTTSGRSKKLLVMKIKKYCACATIAVVGDLLTAFAVNVMYSPHLYLYDQAIMNVEILANTVVIVGTYDGVFQILTAILHACKSDSKIAPK